MNSETEQAENLQDDEIEVRVDENESHEDLEFLAGAGLEDSQVDHDEEADKEEEESKAQKEEESKDDTEEYGAKVKRKIGNMTKRMRDEERARVAAEARAADLQARLEEIEENKAKAEEERYEKNEKSIKDRIKTAAEEEDWAVVMELNDELRELDKDKYMRAVKVKRGPARQEADYADGSPTIAPNAQRWMEDNYDWFDKDSPDYDEALSGRAIRWSKKLQRDEMYDPNDPQLYEEINKRLGLNKDDDEQEEEPKAKFVDRGRRSTTPGGRGPRRPKPNPNHLTAHDKKLMRVFLLDPNDKQHQAEWIKRRAG